MKKFFRMIHTERFRWYDEFIIAVISSLVLLLLSMLLGEIIENLVLHVPQDLDPFWATFYMYFNTVWAWIGMVLFILILKHRRPILKAVGTRPKGNTIRFLLLGLLIGGGMNFLCAAAAMINRDIHITFTELHPVRFLLLLFAVFVQSSSEELVDRAYLFQILKKGYRSKWVAIIGNSLIFSLMHGANPGVTPLALGNIFLSGLLFSLFVWYFDSLWCAFGIHTGWNFMQSIFLGLPNSGIVVPYSVFELDTAAASNSLVYNVNFGIEGTVFSVIVLAAACVITYILGKKRDQEPTDVWPPAKPKQQVGDQQ